jgi:GDP-L-fucose synthase
MNPDSRVFVAGHRGMVGSGIVRRLQREGYGNLILRTRQELDLRDRNAVDAFFRETRPEYVFLAAAKVGGILANDRYPVDFLMDNLAIELAVIDAAHRTGVRKLLFLGSSCVYPKHAPQPIREEYLLTGPLEPTNEGYALAKIVGIRMCQAYRRQHGDDFISAMPTNLYGPNDNFDLNSSHVIPALIRKFHAARVSGAAEVEVWGTGTPRREFLHVDDLSDACVFLMQTYSGDDPVNIGWGEDLEIGELAALIRDVVGCECRIVYDTDKPDGTPRKLLDTTRLTALGWRPQIRLREGLVSTYAAFLSEMGYDTPTMRPA